MKILENFPSQIKPREVQINTLIDLLKNWDKADVFVVNLPVASGKSAIAMTLANWKKNVAVLTPSNILVDQYTKDYPKMPVLFGKDRYECKNDEAFKKCVDRKKHCDRYCAECPYLKDNRRIMSSYTTKHVTTYHLYMALIYKLYKEILVIDEAHNLVPFLQDMNSYKIWRHKDKYPKDAVTRRDLKVWLDNMKDPENHSTKGVRILYKDLNTATPKFIVEHGTDLYYGVERDCLKVKPIDVRDEPPILWQDGINKKIVLMSATIGPKDIEVMGLGDRKVVYINAPSPIPAPRRPVLADNLASMSARDQDRNLPKLIEYIRTKLLEHPNEKGLIHATYGLAEKIRTHLRDERIIYHDRDDKIDVFKRFKESNSPLVMVASGLYEGVDLPYDSGRFQIITKVPWPSLAEPAIRYKCKLDDKWYAWETAKIMLQACGRICRTLDDYGITYIPDCSFERLYINNLEMFPEWFQESVTFPQETLEVVSG